MDDKSETPLFIVASHQARMHCLLGTLYSSHQALKFKNGAMITFKVEDGRVSSHCELIWEGELPRGSKETSYFSTASGTRIADAAAAKRIAGTVMDGQYIIIRHGDGTHNQAKREGAVSKALTIGRQALRANESIDAAERIRDAQLTKAGRKQAERAGIELGKYIAEHSANLSIRTPCYCSDLFRTQQTLAIALDSASERLYSMLNMDTQTSATSYDKGTECAAKLRTALLVVLPCNHEIVGGKCLTEVSKFSPENTPMGNRLEVEGHRVDTAYYEHYYKQVYGKNGRMSLDGSHASRCGPANNLLHSIYLFNLYASGEAGISRVSEQLMSLPLENQVSTRNVLTTVGTGISRGTSTKKRTASILSGGRSRPRTKRHKVRWSVHRRRTKARGRRKSLRRRSTRRRR